MAAETPKPVTAGPKAAAALLVAIAASLVIFEGDKSTPYQDQVGVWTVCKGITGPGVVPGKRYSKEECSALEQDYLNRMLANMGRCITPALSFGEWVAYGHFTYNIGTKAFCGSTLAKKLNAGDRVGACKQMARWTFIRKNGVLVNCRDPPHRCGGLPKRRDHEVQMCLDAIAGQ